MILIYTGILLIGIYILLFIFTAPRIRQIDEVPFCTYSLVLGAGLEKSGKPSDILSDRVLSAVQLYKSNRTKILVMSGSKAKNLDEPFHMAHLAHQHGIPQSAIILDHEGKSTFHSLVNFINRQPKEKVIIVSQYFHLPRAVFFSRLLGIDSHALAAGMIHFSRYKILCWTMREIIAVPYNFFKLLDFLFRNLLTSQF